jgi:O-antigen/teichoic acid export membrane protein
MTSQGLPDIGRAPGPLSRGATDEVRTAIRDGLRLGASLLLTWTVALVMRLVLPRHLGPAQYGLYTFADGFAATYFVFLSLGLEMYVQKEIPVRPAHASDFFGGMLLLRAALSIVLLSALELTLRAAHRPVITQRLVLVFGLAQLFTSVNQALAALLQARSSVGGLAVTNVAGKVVWGLGIGAGLAFGAPLEVLALALLLSEGGKSLALLHFTRRDAGLRLRLDGRRSLRVLVASLPFYVNAVAITMCAKLDVTMLSFLGADNTQVGWYSASSSLATVTMLLAPLVGWVVTPLLSRTAKRSIADFWTIVRRSIQAVQTVMIPLTLFVVLGADVWVRWLFGPAFAPAAMSLRALAPTFFFTYTAMLLALALVILDRAWTLTWISLGGLVVNPLLATILVPLCRRWLGPGGAGVGSGLAVVGMEVTVSTLMLVTAGRRAFDRHVVAALGKTLGACLAATVVHVLCRGLGPSRLAIDVVVYLVVAFASGAIDLGDLRRLLQERKGSGGREEGEMH